MRKVIIIGCPGSGKSTFARGLSEKTGLPIHHLDNIWFRPDGEHITRDEFDGKLGEILAEDEWIIDGNYQRTLGRRLDEADTVILMDIPIDECMKGIRERIGIKRKDFPCIKYDLDEEFATRVWSFGENELPRIYNLLKTQVDKKVVIFHKREDADRFLSKCKSIDDADELIALCYQRE